ncbi:MAG: hypothetical protein QM522_11485 [Chitinophagaceae bacterium]|nr:hypothetical protein [Chitinophagaceae bacterium]
MSVPEGLDGQAFLKSAGNVQRVKRSVRAYLSKYMTKGGGDVTRWLGTTAEALIPRQWWFWTKTMRAWVLEHVLPIAFAFLAWVHEYRKELEAQGLIRARLIPLSDPRAPHTYEVSWLGLEQLGQVVAAWQLDSWDAEWFATERVRLAGMA